MWTQNPTLAYTGVNSESKAMYIIPFHSTSEVTVPIDQQIKQTQWYTTFYEFDEKAMMIYFIEPFWAV